MRWTVFLLSAALLCAQGTKPKPTAAEYDVHGQNGPLDIGAEYMVHSYSAGEQMYLAPAYLVVEVAIYPLMKDDRVTVEPSQFTLRVNGRTAISPHSAAQAAASLRAPWSTPRTRGATGSVGIGGIHVPMGQPQPGTGGYPQGRPPAQPRAPEPDPPGGIERERMSPEEILMQTALPEGAHKGPISGFLFFPFTGKTYSIKSLQLEFGSATLKLK